MYVISLSFTSAVLTASLALAQDAPLSDATEGGKIAPPVFENALTNPPLGLGLGGVNDWSTQYPFLDVFKTSREWIGHRSGQWGGIDEAEIRAVQDPHGWLTAMPAGASHVSAIILTEFPAEMTSAGGRYRLSYQGKGEIKVMNARTVSIDPGEIIFEYRPNGQSMVSIDLTRIDPSDPIREIHVVHERDLARFDAGEVFNPAWLARVHDMRLLRYMDWMRTNDSVISDWKDRAEPADYTWGGNAGVPLEVMVDLANQTGTDPWFTLPHLASPDYIEHFATYVRDNLDPKLKPWFEYSNEVWNWQFSQAQWANEQGRALWPDLGSAWVEYYAGKSVEMAEIIDKVYGADVKDRVVKVISTQTGWLSLEEAILDAPNWRKMVPGREAPASHFNAYAITGYFDGALGRDDKPNVVMEWLIASRRQAEAEADAQGLSRVLRHQYIQAHRFDRAVETAIRELRDGSVTGNSDGSLKALYETFAYHHRIAQAHGLELVMYEGGTHIVGVGPWVEDEELTEFFLWLNRSEGMGQLYTELLDGWKANGGTLFNAFVDIGRHNKFGAWGNLEHIDDTSPRWDALTRFNRDTQGWWEDRAPNAFIGTLEKASSP